MLCGKDLCAFSEFQSSPTPKGGRYKLGRNRTWALHVVVQGCFNPRPPRKVGATPPVSIPSSYTDAMFQSSPTPKGGRYYLDIHWRLISVLFQSSPTPKGGRYFFT